MTRKGELEARIKSVCDRYVMGLVDEPNMLTPYRIVQHLVQENETLPKPSVGAVSACLKRWYKIGFIEVGEKPFSFDCYTEAAEIEGLLSLKKKYRASLKKKNPDPFPAKGLTTTGITSTTDASGIEMTGTNPFTYTTSTGSSGV